MSENRMRLIFCIHYGAPRRKKFCASIFDLSFAEGTDFKMKRIFSLFLIFALLALTLAGCASPDAAADDPGDSGGSDVISIDLGVPLVVCSSFPAYDFARNVAGDAFEVMPLVPAGTDSHSYEPTPADIISVGGCDVFIYIGSESEIWVEGVIASAENPDMLVVRLMDCVEALEEELVEGMERDRSEESAHGDEAEYDEHIWTSPKNAMLMTGAIRDAFISLYPGDETYFSDNAERYLTALDALDADFRAVTGAASRKTIVFGDRFPFRYLAEEYGLEYYAAFPGCSAQSEPSAQTVAFLIDRIVEEDIPIIFYIEFSNRAVADSISLETGAEPLLLHSAHNLTAEEFTNGETYLSLMRQNLENLRQALS